MDPKGPTKDGTAEENSRFDHQLPAVNFSAEPEYFVSQYDEYLRRNDQTNELAIVCESLVRSAVILAAEEKEGAFRPFVWNDRLQLCAKQPVACWRFKASWETLNDLIYEYREFIVSRCEDFYVGYSYGEPNTCVRDGSLLRIWSSYNEASTFIKCFQRISQVLFEHGMDAIHCPFSFLFDVHGVYMTATVLPPIVRQQPIPTANGGCILGHLVQRLKRSLFLINTDEGEYEHRLPVHQGWDDRYYILDITDVIVWHKHLLFAFSLKLLRKHFLSGTDKSREHFAEEDVSREVSKSLVETVEVQLKENKGITPDQLLKRNLMKNVYEQHGASHACSYFVLVELNRILGKVEENPALARRRIKLKCEKMPESTRRALATLQSKDSSLKQSTAPSKKKAKSTPLSPDDEDLEPEASEHRLESFVAFQSNSNLKKAGSSSLKGKSTKPLKPTAQKPLVREEVNFLTGAGETSDEEKERTPGNVKFDIPEAELLSSPSDNAELTPKDSMPQKHVKLSIPTVVKMKGRVTSIRRKSTIKGKPDELEHHVAVLAPSKQEQPAPTADPHVNVKAVTVARNCVMTDMALRCVKAAMRSEICAPKNNQERYFQALLSSRVDLVNRISKLVIENDEGFWKNISRIAQEKYFAPSSFEITPGFIFPRFVITRSAAAVGAVFDAAKGKFSHFKSISLRHTFFQIPQSLERTLNGQNQSMDARELMDEYELASQVASSLSLTRQCVLQRCAFIGMLNNFKLSQKVAEELYHETVANHSLDPYSTIVASGLAVQIHALMDNREAAREAVEYHMQSLAFLTNDVDLPYRAERENITSVLLEDLNLVEGASELVMESVRSVEAIGEKWHRIGYSDVHLQRFLRAIQLAYKMKKEKYAEHCVHQSMKVADVLEPVEDTRVAVSRSLLEMPTRGNSAETVETLKRIATASVAYHERHYGNLAPETCTARNILAELFINNDEAVPSSLRDQVLVGLEVLEGEGGAILSADEKRRVDVVAPTKKPEPEDEDVQPEELVSNSSIVKFDESTIVSPKPKPKPKPQPKAKTSKYRRHTLASHALLQKENENSRLGQIKQMAQQMRILMKQAVDRETFWAEFCGSFLNVAEGELSDRQRICAAQQEEQFRFLNAAHDRRTVRVLNIMHMFFNHFIAWDEHRNIVILFEKEEREKLVLWEESDWKRLWVREEFLHRRLIEIAENKTRRGHLLLRSEYLKRLFILGQEQFMRHQLILEARIASVRQWEAHEKRHRNRFMIGMEHRARQEIYRKEEFDLRRALTESENATRRRLVSFMNFVGLEYNLRGIEYFEGIERGKVWTAGMEEHRKLKYLQSISVRTMEGIKEVMLFEQLSRSYLWFCEEAAVQQLLREQESLYRMQVAVCMLDHSLFAVEVYDYYERCAMEHLEIVAWEDITKQERKEYMKIAYTPDMRVAEFDEARGRRAVTLTRIEELTAFYMEHEAFRRTKFIEKSEIRERGYIVANLHGSLESVFEVEIQEFTKLEALFRQMCKGDEAHHRRGLLELQETSDRAIVRGGWNYGLTKFVERQELFFRAKLHFLQAHEFFTVLMDKYGYIIHLGMLKYCQFQFKSLHRLVQDELWGRADIINDACSEFTYIVCGPMESIVRHQIMKDSAIVRGAILFRHSQYCAVKKRLYFIDEAEYQQRCIVELQDLAFHCFVVEKWYRRLIEWQREHELVTMKSSGTEELQETLSNLMGHFENFWSYDRDYIEATEWKERKALEDTINPQFWWLLRWSINRREYLREEVEARERKTRWGAEIVWLYSHGSLVNRLRTDIFRLHEKDYLLHCESRERHILIFAEHISVRALFERIQIEEMAFFYAEGIRLNEDATFSGMLTDFFLEEKWLRQENERMRFLRLAQEEFRFAIADGERESRRGITCIQEAHHRFVVAAREIVTGATVLRHIASTEEFIAWQELQLDILVPFEDLSRQAVYTAEADGWKYVVHQFFASNERLFKELLQRTEIRENAIRLEIMKSELEAAEEMYRGIIGNLHDVVHLAGIEGGEREERADLMDDYMESRLAIIHQFAGPALALIPSEEGTARNEMEMQGLVELRNNITNLAFGMFADAYTQNFLMLRREILLTEHRGRREILTTKYIENHILLQERSEIEEVLKRCDVEVASIFQEECLSWMELHHWDFSARRYSLIKEFLLRISEPRTRFRTIVLRAEGLRELAGTELIAREDAERRVIQRSRRIWLQFHFYNIENMLRACIRAAELREWTELAKYVLPFHAITLGEKIWRTHVEELEGYRRRVIFFAQETVRRNKLTQEFDDSPIHLVACEIWMRCRLYNRYFSESQGLWTSRCCTALELPARRVLEYQFILGVFLMVEQEESSARKVYTDAVHRFRERTFFVLYFDHVIAPQRDVILTHERRQRFTAYQLRDLPVREVDTRATIEETRAIELAGLMRKEKAWRSCAVRWDEKLGDVKKDEVQVTESPRPKPKSSAKTVNFLAPLVPQEDSSNSASMPSLKMLAPLQRDPHLQRQRVMSRNAKSFPANRSVTASPRFTPHEAPEPRESVSSEGRSNADDHRHLSRRSTMPSAQNTEDEKVQQLSRMVRKHWMAVTAAKKPPHRLPRID